MATIKRLDVRRSKKKWVTCIMRLRASVSLYMLAEADAKEVLELLAAFIDLRSDLF